MAGPVGEAEAGSVRIRVDGVEYPVREDLTLLQALDGLGLLNVPEGVEIPHYCWHPHLAIDGSCRLCQVELTRPGDEQARLAIACDAKVCEGLVVDTKSEAVARAREGVMELLLANHPLDCPICDQAGECRLQDHAFDYGVAASRMREPRRAARKRVDLGPTVALDQERCILCRRCVRFCREVTGTGELGVVERGDRSAIETFPGQALDNPYSMNVADICPVGALTTKDFRFKARVWSLDEVDGICTACARGCNVSIGVARGRVQRYVARRNDAVNGSWICDEGRLSYQQIDAPDRLSSCLARDETGELCPVSLDEAVREAARRLRPLLDERGPGVVAGVASGHASNEDVRAFKTFLDVLDVDTIGLALREGAADELLVSAEKAANAAGARAVGFGPIEGLLERLRGGGLDALLVLGHDLLEGDVESPALDAAELEGLDTVIVFDTHRSPLERVAHLVFPVRHAAEKEGSYTNLDGVVQRPSRAVRPAPGVRDERDFLDRIGVALGLAGYGMDRTA